MKHTLGLAIFLLVFMFAAKLYAQTPGSLDPGFNPGNGPEDKVLSIVAQPDGKILIGGEFEAYKGIARKYIARINPDASLDASFNLGLNLSIFTMIRQVVLQPDGKIIIVGDINYTTNGISRNSIARLNADGSIDGSFNPGSGANYSILACVLQPDGKIIIGGRFSSYNGVTQNHIARINPNGSLDTTFAIGYGTNLEVSSLALQPDGKLLVGGFFSLFNGTRRDCIARLNPDGTVDTSFNPGLGADGMNANIYTIALQPDGKIMIGGLFTSYNGTLRNHIARLNPNGTLDTSFNPGTGANYSVHDILVQPDGKIIIGGAFTAYNGTTLGYFGRLNANGTLDASFNTGTGANGYLHALYLQPDGKVLLGGDFRRYNGSVRNYIARVNAYLPTSTGEELLENQNLILYPNPTSGLLHLELPDTQLAEIEVLNSLGQKIIQRSEANYLGKGTEVLDLSMEPKGVYMVQIKNEKGLIMKKVIVE